MPLEVSDRVPYGNVADVQIAKRPGEYEVSFAAHPHGGPECLWFCFRIRRVGVRDPERSRLRLVLKYSENMLGGNNPATLRPVARGLNGQWERLAPGSAEALPDGRRNVVWNLQAPDPVLDIAFCYPYGPPELAALLEDCGGTWQSDTIGVSPNGRPIVRLSNRYGEPEGTEPGVYLISRQHSAETTGSWVLDGLLRELAAHGDAAPLVWVIPFANIDGVMQGDYGKDNFPYDLNRAWGPVPMRHESLLIQRDMQRWAQRCRPLLAADFHSPGGCESDGIYCFLVHPKHAPEQYDKTLKWTGAVRSAMADKYASDNFERTADYASRWETPNFTRSAADAFQIAAFSMETPYGQSRDLVLTTEHYREAGAQTARGLLAAGERRGNGGRAAG